MLLILPLWIFSFPFLIITLEYRFCYHVSSLSFSIALDHSKEMSDRVRYIRLPINSILLLQNVSMEMLLENKNRRLYSNFMRVSSHLDHLSSPRVLFHSFSKRAVPFYSCIRTFNERLTRYCESLLSRNDVRCCDEQSLYMKEFLQTGWEDIRIAPETRRLNMLNALYASTCSRKKKVNSTKGKGWRS